MVAAGGLCQPLQPLYDVEVIGSADRPVRDALVRFGVDRGGIQYRPPTSAAAALLDAVTVWSVDQDAAQGDTGDTKGCFEVICPSVEEAMIYAVSLCLQFGNITARFDPESTAANIQQGMIAHARKAENELLRAIQNECKVLSAPKVIGASRDILANIDKAGAYYRNRHRIDTAMSLTMIMPAWVRYLMRTDIARQMAAGDWMDALGVADSMIDGWFRNRGVAPVWHLDGDIGGVSEVQTVTVTGGPTGGSYTLTFTGQTTAPIAWNATATVVRDALADLSNIRYSDITVAGGPHPGTAITVRFAGQYEHTDVAQMTASGAGLTGGTTPAVTVTTTTASSLTSSVNGVSIASQVYAEAAAGAVIPGYPDVIDALLFTTGGFLFLDGGTLDLGLVRDSALNARNRYQQFSETFEGIANRTVEPLRLAMTVQPTGQTAGTADTSAIAD
ncbi:MAG: major capsid protein [Pseudonocardiaceae bacterium]